MSELSRNATLPGRDPHTISRLSTGIDDTLKLALNVHCDTLEADAVRATESQIHHITAAVDKTMSVLNGLKSKLSRTKNLLSATNRIPQEILMEIFLYAVPSASNCSHVFNPELAPAPGKLSPVTISHVCQHWRAIALSTPALWIRHIPRTTAVLRMFLNRSANIPMVLDISFANQSLTSDYVRLLLDQLPRARALYMDFYDVLYQYRASSVEELLKTLQTLRNALPNLEHLHISADGLNGRMENALRTWDTIQWMPPSLKDTDCFPRLRHVFLHSVPIQWDCGVLRHLRTLTMIKNHVTPISLNCLSVISEACPELEELTIHSVPWRGDPVSIQNRPIRFPCLRLARISVDEPRFVKELLDRLAYPSDAYIWINVSEIESNRPTIATLVNAFAALLRQKKEPLERLGISLTDCYAGVYGTIRDTTGSLVLTIECAEDHTNSSLPALSVFDSVLGQDLSHLSEFECNIWDKGSPLDILEWWYQIFARAPNIRRLGVQNPEHAFAAIYALTPMPTEDNDDDSVGTSHTISDASEDASTGALLLLPGLTYLIINEDDFGLWPLDYVLLLEQIEIEDGIVYEVKSLLNARNNHAAYAELTVALGVRLMEKAPPPEVEEPFNDHFQLIRNPDEVPGFLLDPRYQWGCDLCLDELKDSLFE